MKKLVFDKQEVVHVDCVTAANTILGFVGGNPIATIYYDNGWDYYYRVVDEDQAAVESTSKFNDLHDVIQIMFKKGITEFYVV